MIYNYILIAWRNLIKNRVYGIINIIGLAAGLTFALLICSYIWSEYAVNHRLRNAERQYIIQSRWKDAGMGIELTSLGPLAKNLKDNYPDLVANYYRFDAIEAIISRGEHHFKENVALGDSSLLNMYGFGLLQGNSRTALSNPYSVVLSVKMAQKYFGATSVLGKTISIGNFSGAMHDFVVTGLLNKPFPNSVTRLNEKNDNQIFVSTQNLTYFGRNMNWNNTDIVSFIELKKGISPSDLDGPMRKLLYDNSPLTVSKNLHPYLVPLTAYYLQSNGAIVEKTIGALSLIAFFIVFMALINFINLSTSQSTSRIKEISIRKVVGGIKSEIVIQFFVESATLVLGAVILSILGYLFFRELFGRLVMKELPAIQDFPAIFLILPLSLTLILGILAGLYPGLLLSSVKVASALKGREPVAEKPFLQKMLIAFQFFIATVVIISGIVITQQIQFLLRSDLGYSKQYVVTAAVPRDYSVRGLQRMVTIRNQVNSLPEVAGSSISYSILAGDGAGSVSWYKLGSDSTKVVSGESMFSDEYYANTYGLQLTDGVFFSNRGSGSDSTKVVLNKEAVRMFGWKTNSAALGQRLKTWGDPCVYTVAGVTNDFHYTGLNHTIRPVFFQHVSRFNIYRFLCVKLRPGNPQKALSALRKKWSVLLPGAPFEYVFQEQSVENMYSSEARLQHIAYVSGLLAMIIILLGILGLVSINVQKRTKEIGIRKVLGSSPVAIIYLFTSQIIPITLTASILACPITYVIIHSWLSSYAYRIHLSLLPFLFSVSCLTLITSALIALQTLKAALETPTKSLRTE